MSTIYDPPSLTINLLTLKSLSVSLSDFNFISLPSASSRKCAGTYGFCQYILQNEAMRLSPVHERPGNRHNCEDH